DVVEAAGLTRACQEVECDRDIAHVEEVARRVERTDLDHRRSQAEVDLGELSSEPGAEMAITEPGTDRIEDARPQGRDVVAPREDPTDLLCRALADRVQVDRRGGRR